MEIMRLRALRGPNLWTRQTALEALVQCNETERAVADVVALETQLRIRFPKMGPLASAGDTAPLSMAMVLERVALSLQAQAGCPVTFSHTVGMRAPGTFIVIVQYTEEEVARKAMDYAMQLCEAAVRGLAFDLAAVLAELKDLDEELRLGPSTGSIVDAAVARGIPYRRLTQGSLVQFGWGSRQRRIQAAEIDKSSVVAESIAQDKNLTKHLLAAVGVPVPAGRVVRSEEDAWQAANEIGMPVVLKPRDGSKGRGVTVNIRTREHLAAAYAAASAEGQDIIVERYMPGSDYRLLVVGNKLVAAARRDPPCVVGDGVQTIKALVDAVNSDPRRGSGHATALTRIRLDGIARTLLTLQGYTEESVPPKGVRVLLRNNANLSTGGTATDVTDGVHPDIAACAVTAARMVGLDIAGLDLVCESLFKPLKEQNGGFVEVNAAPGLRMHISPSYGKGRDVGRAVIEHMFAPGEDARIPVVAVTGTNGKTTIVRLIAHLFAANGLRVGFTTTEGVYVGKKCIDTGDCSGPRSARKILAHPDVDAAVLETARGGMLREGLAFDRCAVAVVTNIGMGDHLGLDFITTTQDLAKLKRVIVQNVAGNGVAVLNAADPSVAAMAAICRGSVIFFARDKTLPVMRAHHAQGQRIVYVEGNTLVAAHGDIERRIALQTIALTHNGSIGFQVENSMAAVAAAWGAAIPWEAVERGLASFDSDAQTVPGRFNIFKDPVRKATVIADYGHNPDAIVALAQAVQAIPAKRRIVVISGAGDRRDEDIREQTRILGGVFDETILYQDQCQRGRADGEVLALLREGLQNAQRTATVSEIRGEALAIDTAFSRLGEGDLCLILIDQVEQSLAQIKALVGAA